MNTDFDLDELDEIVNSLSSPESGFGSSPERLNDSNDVGEYYSSFAKENFPYLEIVEQPQRSYRFRYLTEFKDNPHGPVTGEHATKSNKTFPTVKLHNYTKKAIIRCWLCVSSTYKEPHVHQLLTKNDGKGIRSEPHDIIVDTKNNFTAVFEGLNIIHAVTKKKDYLQCFYQKKCHLRSGLYALVVDSAYDEKALKVEVKEMEKNKAVLYFEAFDYETHQRLGEVCSVEIRNSKNPKTSTLKIARQSTRFGGASGGTEVMIFVERVAKDIKVMFFEEDSLGEVHWEANAEIEQLWHQVAIAFRTPKYRNVDIQEEKMVKFKIIRESDGTFSNEMEFYYQPDYRHHSNYAEPVIGKKRRAVPLQPVENLLPYNTGSLSTFNYNNDQELSESPNQFFPATVNTNVVKDPFLDSNQQNEGLLGESMEYFMPHLDTPFGQCVAFDDPSNLEEQIDISPEITGDNALLLPIGVPPIFADSAKTEDKKAVAIKDQVIDPVTLAKNIFNAINDLTCNPAVFYDSLKKLKQLKMHPDKLRNMYDKTPLHMAIEWGREEYVQPLLAAGCNVDAIDKEHNSALHLAILCEMDDDIINKILSLNPTLTLMNIDGETPFHLACRVNRLSLVNTLIAIDKTSMYFKTRKAGDTSLHIAAKYGHKDIVQVLLENGAPAVAQNYARYTPLHFVIETNNEDLVRLFLSYMNPDVRLNVYLIDIFLTRVENDKIFELLQEYMEEFELQQENTLCRNFNVKCNLDQQTAKD